MSHMHSVTSNLALTIKFQVFLMFNDVHLKLKGFKMFFMLRCIYQKSSSHQSPCCQLQDWDLNVTSSEHDHDSWPSAAATASRGALWWSCQTWLMAKWRWNFKLWTLNLILSWLMTPKLSQQNLNHKNKPPIRSKQLSALRFFFFSANGGPPSQHGVPPGQSEPTSPKASGNAGTSS